MANARCLHYTKEVGELGRQRREREREMNWELAWVAESQLNAAGKLLFVYYLCPPILPHFSCVCVCPCWLIVAEYPLQSARILAESGQ